MHTICLKDNWTLTVLGKNVYDIPETPIETKVPSTVYGTLLEKDLIPDPFYRDNELDALKLMENDFAYETEIVIGEEDRKADRLFLHFDGIDTIADVYLNGEKIGSADNMNRVWEYDITDLVAGDAADTVYQVKVILHSPTKFIEEEDTKCPVGGSSDAMPGFPHIRKAACMYGWDWGPRLPDAGLFREASVLAVKTARLAQVFVGQEHHVTGKTVHGNVVDSVRLTADAEIEWMPGVTDGNVKIVMTVTSPDGKTVLTAESGSIDPLTHSAPAKNLTGLTCELRSNHVQASLTVENPELWWPNGYGAQALYQVKVALVAEDTLDTWEKKMGLRTITVNTDPMEDEVYDEHMTGQAPDYDDGDNMVMTNGEKKVIITDKAAKTVKGRNFAYEINGLQIFAMGADYIPEDNILTRQTRERTDLLLKSAQEANFNSLRIWGGGYFLDDFFYDVCDERGLLIWHDFMFACASYELSDHFEENISTEIRQNVRRLRSHASIALWCGNNEMEMFVKQGTWVTKPTEMRDYLFMYERIIPEVLSEYDPDTFYWPASPSSGGSFDEPNDPNRGDVHYWEVWHGNKPFSEYRKYFFRYASEFGFQSFPSVKTLETVTDDPKELNPFSYVMEKHQRNYGGNGKIAKYMQAAYRYPENFSDFVYASQLLQADGIRYGVEHYRRNRGRCMGAIYWQLNDCWPVISWSSIDYYGRWKALHYYAKRFFAPVMLSCEEQSWMTVEADMNRQHFEFEKSIRLNVTNETLDAHRVLVKWAVRKTDATILREEEQWLEVPALSAVWMDKVELPQIDCFNEYVSYEAWENGQIISQGTVIFSYPKYFHYLNPGLAVRVDGDEIVVKAEAYAKSVEIRNENDDLILEDNYFDMNAGEYRVKILDGKPDGLKVRSVYDI